MKKYEIDARGLACPKPLLKTKQAIEEEHFDELTVHVDNVPARENVIRFLKHSGFQSIDWTGSEETGKISITARPGEETIKTVDQKTRVKNLIPQTPSVQTGGKTILLASNRIGLGKKELGHLLMKGYLYTLTQMETPPACLIFMNTGIKLTLEDSDCLVDIKNLAEKGVPVLVCGTCLDYMNVRDKLGVGQISNMYDIANKLDGPEGVISLT